jgi:hypothetical protein
MALAILILPLVAGCSNDCNDCPDPAGTYAPPYPPDGVISDTGNGQVTIWWNDKPENRNGFYEDDIVEYGIYKSTDYTDDRKWVLVDYVDAGVACDQYGDCGYVVPIPNGQTWYFAVTSVDIDGYESDWSYIVAEDTPRPDGWLVLKDLGQNSTESGYDFDQNTVQAWNLGTTDIYFGQSAEGVFYFYTAAGVDIQDFGYVYWEAVSVAPDHGWAESGRAEVILGHMYVVRIQSGPSSYNYAKIEVIDLIDDVEDLDDKVELNWAYQPVENLPELAPIGGAAQ